MCYKGPKNPNCVDLIIPKNLRSFQNSMVIKTDFPKMYIAVTKIYRIEQKPTIFIALNVKILTMWLLEMILMNFY